MKNIFLKDIIFAFLLSMVLPSPSQAAAADDEFSVRAALMQQVFFPVMCSSRNAAIALMEAPKASGNAVAKAMCYTLQNQNDPEEHRTRCSEVIRELENFFTKELLDESYRNRIGELLSTLQGT